MHKNEVIHRLKNLSSNAATLAFEISPTSIHGDSRPVDETKVTILRTAIRSDYDALLTAGELPESA